MDNIENTLSSLLSNPEDMKKIINIVKSIEGNSNITPSNDGENSESVAIVESKPESKIEEVFKTQKDERTALLEALKPYIKEGKQEKLNSILKIMNTVDIIFAAKNYL